MVLPIRQLVFINFYLDIALGAQDHASQYVVKSTEAWLFDSDIRLSLFLYKVHMSKDIQNKEKAADASYVLERYKYNNFLAHEQ
ncbi:hypothetical protein J1614_011968 [Plenodomus biglobosus]|nr:hypothetical protein J1614_011968 [Plenodomus biglobosus]